MLGAISDPAPDGGHGRTQRSLDYTADEVTALHLQGLAMTTQTVIFLCLPCPFGL